MLFREPQKIPMFDRVRNRHFEYLLGEAELWAMNTAYATGRPLLIVGEPGVGKSQLAKAVAVASGRTFLYEAISARTEAEQLLWRFDSVARLAAAQAIPGGTPKEDVDQSLAPKNFLIPGAFWYAFEPGIAEGIKRGQVIDDLEQPKKGRASVLLIDEIDKADADVPNSLLDIIDRLAFYCPYLKRDVSFDPDIDKPIVIFTSNGERDLPPAFVRRCVVLKMTLGKTPQEIRNNLVERAEAHFEKTSPVFREVGDPGAGMLVTERVASIFLVDRDEAQLLNIKPGLAEFIDFLVAVERFAEDWLERNQNLAQAEQNHEFNIYIIKMLEVIEQYTLKKGESLANE